MCGVRVHAVLLQTERVAGEEHDHRTTSRTNLVDLAGSERCGSAQTSGEQLKVRAPLAPRGLLRAVGGGGARASHTQPDRRPSLPAACRPHRCDFRTDPYFLGYDDFSKSVSEFRTLRKRAACGRRCSAVVT